MLEFTLYKLDKHWFTFFHLSNLSEKENFVFQCEKMKTIEEKNLEEKLLIKVTKLCLESVKL